MAYETATYSGVNDALDKFATFAVANGWTQNLNTLEGGTNRRLHINKSINGVDCHFALKGMLSEVPFSGFSSTYGIALQGATGYNGGSAWNAQPGFTPQQYNVATSMGGVVDNIKAAGGTYHFFAHGTALHAVFETESLYNDWRMFTSGQVGGGIFFECSGAASNVSNNEQGRSSYSSTLQTFYGGGIFDGTYWRTKYTQSTISPYYLCNAVRGGNGDGSQYALANALITYSPDSFRGNAILAPYHVMTTGALASEAIPFGEVEGVKFINMTNYSNEEEIVVGGNTYVLFKQQNRPAAYPIGVALLK